MFRWFERILGLVVFAPPLFMLFRFVRWYARQGSGQEAKREV